MVSGYAAYLHEKGLGKGDAVVARASQTLDYVVVYLAVHLAGGVITSAEAHMPAEGIAGIVRAVKAKGYVNEPELTGEVLIDGVVYTNDIGYIDGEGFVYIAGRKGDVINVGGLKAAPAEVEEAALAIDGIEDCICLPMDHPITGQALKLLVVMREGAEFAPGKFTAFLKTRLEHYKVPIKYEQVESIARTYNGKLDRKAYQKG